MDYYKESLIEFKNWVEHGYAHNTYMPSSFAINTAVDALERYIKLCEVDCYKCKHRELWCYMCNRHPSLSDCYEETDLDCGV